MATALIGAGASLLNGIIGKGGNKSAIKAQTAAINNAVNTLNSQYQQTRSDNLPFLTAGTGALGGVQDLLGLNGNDPQAAAIASLKASPLFTSQYNTGADTILQNAAATGGLRGGNTQNSLAQFGSGLLSDVIQRQLGNLGGLVGLGSGTASTLGQLGQNNAGSVAGLQSQLGQVNGNGALTNALLNQRMIGGLGGNLSDIGSKFKLW